MTKTHPMHYCSECGRPLGTAQARHWLCPAGHRNDPPGPKILVACFVNCGKRLLWVRRDQEPRSGYWAIPAGFMEQGESLAEASARELREETGVIVPPEQLQLYMIGSISYISEVYIAFCASVADTDCQPGPEVREARYFSREELPWDEVAYPSANAAIIQAYQDCEERRFGIYHGIYTEQVSDITLVGLRREES
jgi:8-oxo-dGTP diphosphatase